MSEKPEKPQRESGSGSGNRFPMRGLALWLLVLALSLTLYQMLVQDSQEYEKIAYSPDFVELVEQGKVRSCVIVNEISGRQYIKGELVELDETSSKPRAFKVDVMFTDDLPAMLRENDVKFRYESQNPYLWQILSGAIPFIIVLGLLYFLFIRQMRNAGKGAMSFGKSRAKLLTRDKNKVTFKDVAGVDEAREETQEIIEFLSDPKKFQRLGGRIPKGVLLVGPPGTGKTLLAKAIAGEAEVPFFSISGSDFVEMFVGVGASRVRDMFEQGKKNAPCIIFIDEIDAVGRSRFSGIGGGHDEREQTLNALLVEMDGFETQEGVIIIAATNRPDVLDPALLRPGRFDRQITVDLPPLEGRERILRIHAKNTKLADSVDFRRIARGTPGFSGADLANMMNEAALLAARRNAEAVEMQDVEEARDKVRFGSERRSRMLDESEKKLTAYHEAGHAIVMEVLEHAEPVHKVTIIPRGQSLGSTMQLPEKDRYTESHQKLNDMLVSFMGGRAAEQIVFGDVTTGAANDLKQSTRLARMMVCEWGMSAELGPQTFGAREEHLFLGREVAKNSDYSEETARRIDEEVSGILHGSYDRALEILTTHREQLDTMAQLLLERETLDGRDVSEIIKYGRLLDEVERAEQDPVPSDSDEGSGSEETPGEEDSPEPDEVRVKPATNPIDSAEPGPSVA